MSSPFATYPVPERSFIPSGAPSTPTPARGGAAGTRGTGAKRGRKPKNASVASTSVPSTPTLSQQPSSQAGLQWVDSQKSQPSTPAPANQDTQAALLAQGLSLPGTQPAASTSAAGGESGTPGPAGTGNGASGAPGAAGAEEEGDGEDELLPAMADDDYSAQLSWQSQSKDNLKCVVLEIIARRRTDSLRVLYLSLCRVLMDNFSPAQYERFEAYRRHALPKQAVRKVRALVMFSRESDVRVVPQVIQQATGQQVSQPVAQIVAGFGKVFVGEIVEKGVYRPSSPNSMQPAHALTAREVQARRGDTGPLSPDHLRVAYRMYQEETGRVGAARPLRSKRLFVR